MITVAKRFSGFYWLRMQVVEQPPQVVAAQKRPDGTAEGGVQRFGCKVGVQVETAEGYEIAAYEANRRVGGGLQGRMAFGLAHNSETPGLLGWCTYTAGWGGWLLLHSSISVTSRFSSTFILLLQKGLFKFAPRESNMAFGHTKAFAQHRVGQFVLQDHTLLAVVKLRRFHRCCPTLRWSQ